MKDYLIFTYNSGIKNMVTTTKSLTNVLLHISNMCIYRCRFYNYGKWFLICWINLLWCRTSNMGLLGSPYIHIGTFHIQTQKKTSSRHNEPTIFLLAGRFFLVLCSFFHIRIEGLFACFVHLYVYTFAGSLIPWCLETTPRLWRKLQAQDFHLSPAPSPKWLRVHLTS